MQPDHRDAAYLVDMLDAAEAIARFIGGISETAYLTDEVLQSAIERKVEIIGEAARGISRAFQNAHPQIPWQAIIVQRHVLAHEYGRIDQRRIWRVATVHVPALLEHLRPLVPPPPADA
jgi:uncharacterized protein with HEPN domain